MEMTKNVEVGILTLESNTIASFDDYMLDRSSVIESVFSDIAL
jgi:hypothetical protein